MKRLKQIGMQMMMGGMVVGLFGCSFEGSQYSPEQVINNAVGETVKIGAYYAESETVIREKGKEIEQLRMKEWRTDDGKIRVETDNKDGRDKVIAVNNRETLILYEVDNNRASVIADAAVLNLNMPSPKEQANQLLEMIRETHKISIEGEEKIAGRETYKLQANANKPTSLIGDLQLWVDKENWMVLKTIVSTGDTQSETIYTKIDFKPKLSNDLFTIDLPEDVELQNLDDVMDTTEISLDEVASNIGKPFFYFPEVDGLEITTIELNQLQGEIERNEVNINYAREGVQLLTLSVFESPEEMEEASELEMPGETTIDVRGQEGMKMEVGDLRFLSWQEEGVSYSIMLYDLDTTFEELLEMTGNMERME